MVNSHEIAFFRCRIASKILVISNCDYRCCPLSIHQQSMILGFSRKQARSQLFRCGVQLAERSEAVSEEGTRDRSGALSAPRRELCMPAGVHGGAALSGVQGTCFQGAKAPWKHVPN